MDKNWQITNLNLGLNTSEDYDWSKADKENTLHYDSNAGEHTWKYVNKT
jgi:hypothetical protein